MKINNPMNNSETVRKMLKTIYGKPNNSEKFLIKLFKENNIEFKFVGTGQRMLGNKCPDFIHSKGKKKIIEFFGGHWHNKKDETMKRKYYKKYGYELMVIWDYQINSKRKIKNIIKKIRKFQNEKI
jgi:very-short-patch-repair endonuclease